MIATPYRASFTAEVIIVNLLAARVVPDNAHTLFPNTLDIVYTNMSVVLYKCKWSTAKVEISTK